MSTEAAKRSTTGALTVKQRKIDELKPSPALMQNLKNADMKDDMQKEAVNIAIFAFEKNNIEKDVAEYIKKEFDKKREPTWHCIVGPNFGKPKFQLDSIFMENIVQDICYF
ncbi:dynein light chain 1, cytoplasmic [Gossypium australe]|uniref:Dynein light chain n=1 Tax=Gossypium australe TaxID=47621 RepID=A0A5B6UJC2_9ROSI|nr:dynein light chain 1, cytoplasmic [Gossypium australe]